ncbi:MAG: amidohydrolase family protein [Peptostreptococcaceae bacterium]
MILLKNCKLIKELVEGYDKEFANILITGDKIAKISECELDIEGIEDIKIIDMENKIVMPGLFDIHVHLTLSGGDTLIDNAKTPVQKTLDAVKFAKDTLKAGFTTIRDVGSTDNVAIELRDAINNNKIVGPNIIASGRILTPTESGNDFFEGLYIEVDNKDEAFKAVRTEMKNGADYIKIMASGAVMNPGGVPGQPIYTQREMENIVEAAKLKNTYVAAHCHGTESIKSAIKAGVKTIEHASMLDDECIEMLKEENSYIVVTLSIINGLVESVPESSEFMKDKAKYIKEALKEGISKAYKEGLKIGFATDQGGTPLVHGTNADEFIYRREFFDMKEIDILKQATIDSAKILGVDENYGSIKEGKIADLVIVNGDPLKDISVMKNKIIGVIKSGKYVR